MDDSNITQSLNGRPHLAYYDEGVSFVWSGSMSEPIEVCPGGYGEPVRDRIEPMADLGVAAALQTPESTLGRVRAFAEVCRAWLDRDADDEEERDLGVLLDENAAEVNTDGRW